jgi:hypothetical protein
MKNKQQKQPKQKYTQAQQVGDSSENFLQNHGNKILLGTAIVSAAIMGYWSDELEALIVKNKKIVLVSLGLLLFGGMGHYYWKNCKKNGGIWGSIKKDVESLKNVTKILAIVLTPATYFFFRTKKVKTGIRSIFNKGKEPKIEIKKLSEIVTG